METFQDVRLKPLAGFALDQARVEGAKLRHMRRVVRDVVSHLLLLWVVMAIAYISHSDCAFYSANNARAVFATAQEPNSISLAQVKT